MIIYSIKDLPELGPLLTYENIPDDDMDTMVGAMRTYVELKKSAQIPMCPALILILILSTKFTPSQLVTAGNLNIIYFVTRPIPEEMAT